MPLFLILQEFLIFQFSSTTREFPPPLVLDIYYYFLGIFVVRGDMSFESKKWPIIGQVALNKIVL